MQTRSKQLLCLALIAMMWSANSRTSDAGIVVTNAGRVFRGRIRKGVEDIDDNKVRMRWPYKNFRGPQGGLNSGFFDFPRKRIRWFNPDSDDLTDEYFKLHGDKPIEARFQDAVDTWKDRQAGEPAFDIKEIAPIIRVAPEHKLLPLPQKQRYYEINKPRSWATKSAPIYRNKRGKTTDKILMMISPEAKHGYAARIHVVSVRRPKLDVTTTDQRNWYLDEIRKLVSGERYEVKEKQKINAIGANRKDVTMVTASRIPAKGSIVALRAIRFRQDRIYFVTCYAHEAEFASLRKMFERCIDTMLIYEDQRAGE